MPERNSYNQSNSSAGDQNRYQVLSIRQLQMIDEALASVGEYGEVRLVVEKSRLRFIVTERSYDVQKWIPGILVNRGR